MSRERSVHDSTFNDREVTVKNPTPIGNGLGIASQQSITSKRSGVPGLASGGLASESNSVTQFTAERRRMGEVQIGERMSINNSIQSRETNVINASQGLI